MALQMAQISTNNRLICLKPSDVLKPSRLEWKFDVTKFPVPSAVCVSCTHESGKLAKQRDSQRADYAAFFCCAFNFAHRAL